MEFPLVARGDSLAVNEDCDSDYEDDRDDVETHEDYEPTVQFSLPYKLNNYKLLRYLRQENRRKTHANECKIASIMALRGAWGGQRHVWTFHERPMRHFYLYNPSRVVARGNLTFPSAVWFFDAAEARAAGMLGPPPPVEQLWANYERHVERHMLDVAVARCARCDGHCWRTAPHIELADFTNRPILETWARFARRDTARALDLIVRIGASRLLERCECSRCSSEDGGSEPTGTPSERQTSPSAATASYAIALDDAERYIPPEVTNDDYDFVAARRIRDNVVLDRRVAELRNWHTGNIGCVLRWLLEEDHIDSSRYAAEIDRAFARLYGVGNTSLAFVLGLYASRACVENALRRFYEHHQLERFVGDQPDQMCDNAFKCSCLYLSTSRKSRIAAHALSIARNIPWQYTPCHLLPMDSNVDIYADTAINVSAAEIMGERAMDYDSANWESSPPPAKTVDTLAAMSWHNIFVNFGVKVLRDIMRGLALPASCAESMRVISRRVLMLCNRIYVTLYLEEWDSILGGCAMLLGHCDPCLPRRPIGNPNRMRVPRFHNLPDLTYSRYFFESRW